MGAPISPPGVASPLIFLPRTGFPMRHALLVAVTVLSAPPAGAAQRAPVARPPDARALVAQAERLQDVDDTLALKLVRQALPLLRGPQDRVLRVKALALECWTSAGAAEPAALVALAERGMAEARAAGDARGYADLR